MSHFYDKIYEEHSQKKTYLGVFIYIRFQRGKYGLIFLSIIPSYKQTQILIISNVSTCER